MKLKAGTKVLIQFFHKDIIEEGTLQEDYTVHQCVYKNRKGEIVVVANPDYKIFRLTIISSLPISIPKTDQVAILEPLEPTQHYEDEKERALELAELYKERAEIERENARQALTSKTIKHIPIPGENYGGLSELLLRRRGSDPFSKHSKKKT